ncbi:hypothetical protein FNF29_00131 [Cafeteria roenbergensis]|uniref:WASH1 WAHD domain-containing protein n=1 Tax=Cafeteria roenbergensis TaxID=33653 RepID=A0A5A8E2E7_CAFRO|nr:hypothetical protein FNF29_00131 [Cafeteria roenbergensis]KAA0160441.1 hypothetical protein FNF31_04310 [Cafeteria roenbergensis]KAA0171975.1 hypothetical protein FNF28_00292 [Cafeteria roenbergensis]|eukprot:KAA0157555.1 hypothetical protein FNF29_00131 [Cafeteria roenbergensis]
MAARVAQVHSVPLAYHDVCQDDAVRLIMESLVALDRTANNIFSAIEDRVAQGKTALASLNGRIDECRGKVQSIAATTTRATTILCPTKFPAGTKAIPFTPALAGRPYVSEAPDMIDQVPVASGGGNPRRMELEEPQDSTTPGMRMATLEVIIESRMLMHPADTAAASETPTGLGQLPRSVGSVADTLLFNSTQVPYKDYARLDNLMRAGRAAQESKEEEEEGDLGAAPATLLEHNDLPEVAGFDLSYRPAAPTVQQLEMPSAIGLPNVADVSWSDAAGDGRSSLLDALRNPNNLKKLRKADSSAGDAAGSGSPATASKPAAAPAAPAGPPKFTNPLDELKYKQQERLKAMQGGSGDAKGKQRRPTLAVTSPPKPASRGGTRGLPSLGEDDDTPSGPATGDDDIPSAPRRPAPASRPAARPQDPAARAPRPGGAPAAPVAAAAPAPVAAAAGGDGSSDISGSLVSDMSDEDDDLEEPEASPDTGVAYRPGMSLAQLLGRAGDADTGAGAAASPAPAPQPAAAPAPFDLTALPGFAMARSIAASSQVGAEQGGDDGDDDEWDE